MASINAANRLTQNFPASGAGKVIFSPSLGGKIRRGNVVLTGPIVISAGTTNGTVVGDGGPVNLISRVIVNATPAPGSRYPGGRIVDALPRDLLRYAANQHQGKVVLEQSGSVLGSGAAGTYPIYLSIPIYWSDATLLQGQGLYTALNTDAAKDSSNPNGTDGGTYQSLQVEIDTAALTACFSGNDRTVDYSGLQIQWVDERVAQAGDTVVRYQESHSLVIQSANKRALDAAMPQDGAFESIQLLGEQGAAQTLSDALLNKLRISGPTIEYEKYAQDIRQTMIDDEWLDPSQTATGLYSIDLTDGMLGNSVPANGLQIQFDVNNPSGANLDQFAVFTRRIFAPLPAAAKAA